MNTLHMKYVVVGGGGAGSAAAEAIRQRDPVGTIVLIGQEHSRPYIRPALSKEFLRRNKNRMAIATEPVGWYREKQIELRTSRRVAHLDTARRAVTLDNGEEISFEKLLLATGASPRPLHVPGAELPNVFYLRNIDDADRLHHAIDKARNEGRPHPKPDDTTASSASALRGRAAVVGSGLLAVEVAASLRQMNLHVELIAARAYPWAKIAGDSTGKFLSRYLEARGIAVHNNTVVQRLDGDGRVQRLLTSTGQQIDCDFVVAALGITPNRDLLRGTSIAAENAILVDQHCRTSVADIFAAGDCAAILDPLFGKHRLLDHWDSARTTGAIAGANMAGDETVQYEGVNRFFSDVFDLKLIAWGESRLVDRRLVRGTPNIESPDFAEIGVAADGRVAQVLAIGRASEHKLLRELVAKRFAVDGHEEALKDPARDLRELMNAR